MQSNDQKINAIIIDNEIHCIEELRRVIKQDKRVNIQTCVSDSRMAVKEIIRYKPDLLFLDIEMPGLNGFDVVEDLKTTGLKPFVIFVTAFRTFALEAIKHKPFDYLIKPVEIGDLRNSIDQYIEYFKYSKNADPSYYNVLQELTTPKRVKLKTTGGFVMLDYHDIIYIEADWNYSKIFTGKDKFETVTMNIGSLEKLLPPDQYARINRSHIINLSYLKRVKRLNRQCILVKDCVEYQLSIPMHKIRMLERML